MRFNEAAGIPPRKTKGRPKSRCIECACFNEAAGIPRGRHVLHLIHAPAERASMRPRVFPAEDRDLVPGHRADAVASMRPRVFPAEDSGRDTGGVACSTCFNEAAGIPRGRPENVHALVQVVSSASMRPRVFPAEDSSANPVAPAECRDASMRPRVFPAEDSRVPRQPQRLSPSFNEAAGIPRGRRRHSRRMTSGRQGRFNEAAGIPRGRPSWAMLRSRNVSQLQ